MIFVNYFKSTFKLKYQNSNVVIVGCDGGIARLFVFFFQNDCKLQLITINFYLETEWKVLLIVTIVITIIIIIKIRVKLSIKCATNIPFKGQTNKSMHGDSFKEYVNCY